MTRRDSLGYRCNHRPRSNKPFLQEGERGGIDPVEHNARIGPSGTNDYRRRLKIITPRANSNRDFLADSKSSFSKKSATARTYFRNLYTHFCATAVGYLGHG